MPPRFSEREFLFANGETVPEHVEDHPRWGERELGKWCVRGSDASKSNPIPLASDVETAGDATLLATARLRYLEAIQPTSISGGQEGNQDRVYIVKPREIIGRRFLPPELAAFENSTDQS